MVTQSMQLVNNVSDAALELSVPDEENIAIQTSGITFALGRHSPAKLAGLQIQSAVGKFVLPAVLVSRIINTSQFVDTQVKVKNSISLHGTLFAFDETSKRFWSSISFSALANIVIIKKHTWSKSQNQEGVCGFSLVHCEHTVRKWKLQGSTLTHT